MAIDVVKPLKEEINGVNGGTQTDPYPTEMNPTVDYVGAVGLAYKGTQTYFTSLDANNNITFTDATATWGQLYDHWNNTTQYLAKSLRRYTNNGTTDSNGRYTFYPTTTGTATGTALFSSIVSINAIAVYAAASAIAAPNMYIESISTDLRTIVARGTTGTTIVTILINGSNTLTFLGSGVTVYVQVEGVRNT